MQLTVIVCTHNRARLLELLLRSLFAAQRPPDTTLEILIIANACVDDTPDLLGQWSSKAEQEPDIRLRWAEEPVAGKSHALNRALALLDGDAAVFIDDDHRVDPGFLRAIVAALEENPLFGILCGRILPDWDGREPAWVHDDGDYRIYPPPVPVFDAGAESKELTNGGFMPGGGNLVFRAPLLGIVGRFSTELGPRGHDLAGGEDSEFLKRAIDKGARLFYEPRIVQYHHVDLSRLKLSRMMRLSYQRSLASTRIHHGQRRGPPLYLWRKLFGYLAAATLSLDGARRRFYLVRLAAAFGEIRGLGRG